MNNRLINVRLDERRVKKARRLRSHGIALSDLVRDAIDRKYEEVIKSGNARDVEVMMKEIYEAFPDPPNLPSRKYDVHDSREARAAILRKLPRRHR